MSTQGDSLIVRMPAAIAGVLKARSNRLSLMVVRHVTFGLIFLIVCSGVVDSTLFRSGWAA